MRYRVTHTTTYTYGDVVPICHNEVCLTPRDGGRQTCRYHRLSIKPLPATIARRFDYFGNSAHHFSIQEKHRRLTVVATSRVEVRPPKNPEPTRTPAWEQVRDAMRSPSTDAAITASQFTFSSPRIARSNALADYAATSFEPGRSVLEAVSDLTARIHGEFHYDTQATAVHTPTDEVLTLRRGVCQDFAHLQIGCLRSLGLPARYVSGYLRTLPPPGQPRLIGVDASHAWLSVYCGDELGWVDVDPTNNTIPQSDHITLAWGRDYGDVCPIKGVFIGGGGHTMTVAVDVEPVGERN